MADAIADKKNEHEITLERLRRNVDVVSKLTSSISPFINSTFYNDKELFDIFADTSLVESDDELLSSIRLPENAKTSHLRKIVDTVHSKLLSEGKARDIERSSLDFTENLKKIQEIYNSEFPDENDSGFEKERTNFISQLNTLNAVIERPEVRRTWTAYPLFIKRYSTLINDFFSLIEKKMSDTYNQLDDDAKTRFTKENQKDENTAAPRGSTLPFSGGRSLQPSGSSRGSDESGGKLSVNEQRLLINQGIEDEIKRATLVIAGMNETQFPDNLKFDDLFARFGFVSKKFNDRDYENAKARVRAIYDKRRSDLGLLPEGETRSRSQSRTEEEANGKKFDFAIAKKLIEDETERQGSALTKGQIDTLLFKAGFERADEGRVNDLYQASLNITSTKNVASKSDIENTSLPTQLKQSLARIQLSKSELQQIVAQVEKIQRDIKESKLDSPTAVRQAIQQALPNISSSTLAVLQESTTKIFLDTANSPAKRSSDITIHATITDLLRDPKLRDIQQITEETIDNVALALQIATVTSQNQGQINQSLERALKELGNRNINISLALRDSGFRTSLINELAQRSRRLQALSIFSTGKVLASNRLLRETDPDNVAKILLQIEAVGGVEVMITMLLRSPEQRKQYVETLEKISTGSMVLPPTPDTVEVKTDGDGSSFSANKVATDNLNRTYFILLQNKVQVESGKAKQISLDAYLTMTFGSGKRDKAAVKAATALWTEVMGTASIREKIQSQVERMKGAEVTFDKMNDKLISSSASTTPADYSFQSLDASSGDPLSSLWGDKDTETDQAPGFGYEEGYSRNPIYEDDVSSPFSRFTKPEAYREQRRQKANLTTLAQNAKFFLNPAVLGVAGAGVGLGLTISAIATNATLGAFTAGFGAVGAGIGFAVGGPVGAGIGFGIGAAAGNALGHAYLSGSAATGAVQTTQIAGQLSQAALNAAPGTIANANFALGGTGTNVANALGSYINTAVTSSTNIATTLQSSVTMLTNLSGAAPVVVGPLLLTATVALIANSAMDGAFLVPGEVANTCSNYVCITKLATPEVSADPVAVTYTIKVTPKDPKKTVTITKVTDVMSVAYDESQKPTPPTTPVLDATAQAAVDSLKGSLPEDGKTITYTVSYGTEYDDTRITNQVSVEYAVDGTTDNFKTEAAVTFGNPPAAGCWPVTGSITQLPYYQPDSHHNKDAYDIGAPDGTPIISPYSGTALAFNQGGAGDGWVEAGNFVVVKADIGYDFIFEHLSKISISTNGSVPIQAGQTIGLVGHTGNARGAHLHYEVRRGAWNALQPCMINNNCASATSLLATLVPPDITGKKVTSIGQKVSSSTCGSGVGGPEIIREGCFVFSDDGDKAWTDDEILKVRTALKTYVLNNPTVTKLVCSNGSLSQDVTLTRTKASCQDEGGKWSAFTAQSNITFCDTVFEGDFNTSTFGRSTVMHEPAHLIQLRHFDKYVAALAPFKPTFADPTSFYADTYPYKYENQNPPISGDALTARITPENFAEAFGLCRSLALVPAMGYRGKYIGNASVGLSKYQTACNAMNSILNTMSQ